MTHPVNWNTAALGVPMGADPDRDERYRRINAREPWQPTVQNTLPIWRWIKVALITVGLLTIGGVIGTTWTNSHTPMMGEQ